jgi:hypothetical protein
MDTSVTQLLRGSVRGTAAAAVVAGCALLLNGLLNCLQQKDGCQYVEDDESKAFRRCCVEKSKSVKQFDVI